MLVTKSQVKYIQSLGHKKFRDAEAVFVAEGPKIVEELLCITAVRCRQVYALKEWIGHEGARLARENGAGEIPVQVVGEADLERLSGLSTPNRVLALFEKPSFSPPDFNQGITIVLDGIQDPGNLGTIIRIADWFGISRVLCTGDSADAFNAKAIQSTMGSIGRVQVIYDDPAGIMRQYPDLPVYAAVLGGEDLYGMKRTGKGWLVIGNESKGIRPALLELATDRITIPGSGSAESLNAAVATGIILSHLASLP